MRLSRTALTLLALDLGLGLLAWWGAFWLRFNLDIPDEFEQLALQASPWCVIGLAFGLIVSRVDRQVWTFIGLSELRQLGIGVLLGAVLTAVVVLMLRIPNFPRSVLLLQPLLALLLLGAARAAWRTLAERRLHGLGGQPVVIVGSLQDAAGALRALKGSQKWRPVGIVSPIAHERGRSLQTV